MESMRRRLVVASSALADPNFSQTVVLLLDNSVQGTLGIVLNRPSSVDVADTLPRWDALTREPRVMCVSGPVQPQAVEDLCAADEETEAVSVVAPGVGTEALRSATFTLDIIVRGVWLFTGSAGS